MFFISQIVVFGVKPTFRFYCIMKSFQLIKVLVCLEEAALVFLEETVLRPSRLRTGKQQHNSSCCCNGGGNPPSSSRQLLLQQVNPPRHEKGNCCCNVHGNLLSRFITQAPRHLGTSYAHCIPNSFSRHKGLRDRTVSVQRS